MPREKAIESESKVGFSQDPIGEIAALSQQRTSEAAARLRELGDSADRVVSKAARKALFLLRQAGVMPPDAPIVAAEPTVTRASVADRALLTNPDGNGGQVLLFVQEEAYGGSPWLITFLVSYMVGLKELGANKMTRRAMEESFAEMRARPARRLIEAPVDYARHLLQEAVGINRAESIAIPQGYAGLLERVGMPEQEYPRPLIYTLLDAEEVREDQSISRDPKRLFEREEFRGWLFNLRMVEPWVQKFYEAHQTNLALDEKQLAERGEKVIDEAVDSLMSGIGTHIYRRLLEESALALHLAGDEEAAKQAFYHALTLEDGKPPHSVPFSRFLVERSIYVIVAMLAKEAEEREQARKEQGGVIERV